ncbi:MAG: hypothetical protein LBR24_03170 [Methanobrevibacter sp.]|jgi:hypothetical protein|nr:hypothetical protein [Methanobrevibacter sp.]
MSNPIPYDLIPPNRAVAFVQNSQHTDARYQSLIRAYFRAYPPLNPMPDFLVGTIWDPSIYSFLANVNIPTRPSTPLLIWDYRQAYDCEIYGNHLYSVNNPAYCPYAAQRTNPPREGRYQPSYEDLDENL